MKSKVFGVLLAAFIAVVLACILCSCSGCSNRSTSAPPAVQGTAAAQVTPAPAVEKEAAPIVEEIASVEAVVEEAAVEPVAEEAATETEGEEESVLTEEERVLIAAASASAPTAETDEPAEVASVEEPAEEPVVEKAPAQEVTPAAEPVEKSCGSHILTVGLSPWGWQNFHVNIDELDDKSTTYGLGGKLAYTYLFSSGLCLGAEAAYETYFMDHRDNYHDIMFLADVGYNFAIGDRLGLYAGAGGGLTLECYNDSCSAIGTVKASLGFGYSINEHWIIGAGCDGIFAFPTKDEVRFVDTQIVPCITVSYRF